MTVSLRAYREDEFERICEIRGIDSQEWRDRFRKRFDKSGDWDDHYLHFAIDLDGDVIGDLQLRRCDMTRPDGALEVGLEIAPELRGKGLGSSALTAAAQYAFSNGAHRIEGSTEESNTGMRRAFEKAGWNFEGVLKALFIEDGVPHDYYSYAITKFD
jgi:RimJ/RimL family protein N-acetyltransferase